MSLFDKLNPYSRPMPPANNPIIDMFGNFNNFHNQFNQFANRVNSQNMDPKQAVQNLLNSGQMSQDQFNRLSQIANMLTGRKQF